MIEKELREIAEDIIRTVVKKNADYGNSYFELREEFGRVAFVIRLVDKVSRLKTLTGREPEVVEESELDTIRDIVGYCLLELLYRKHED